MGTIDKSTNELIDGWNSLAQAAVNFGLLKKANDDGADIDPEAFDFSEKELVTSARVFAMLCDVYITEEPKNNERK
ncbi:MAG: hypothetical protein CMA71_06200 [Euryarchaeota archaeon]|nr:hypothetical protein [Euryarchaeota archaeon]|tara:strand:- start:1964 stop:2191 length:228 start_codon:yes stop_codon:yes gene_type:complete